MNKHLKQAIVIAGGKAALAEQLGITGQAISQWERVPDKHVIAIEALTGISRRKLRPDIFGRTS